MKTRSGVFLAVLLLPILVLTGCASTPAPRLFADLRYDHLSPIRLDAVRIDIIQKYRSQSAPPHVETLFPLLPAKVMAQWLRDRLRAVGGRNTIRATIIRAAVVEVPLKKSDGLRGVVTKDQSERYDGEIEVLLEIISSGGRQLASVSSRATRSRSVAEDISLAQREKAWFAMLEAMMNDLNASLERQIKENFRTWLR
jgi:hypothetical protein